MTKKYILTGGPGSGKSSILLELEARGEHIIREASEDVIKRYQSRGIKKPWEKPDFQKEILKLQIQRESRIDKNIERVFVDRGIPDGLAYAKQGTDTYAEIRGEIRHYDGIFLIENLGQTETNEIRREDQEEALELELKLKEIYLSEGYSIMKIPVDSVEDRANLILALAGLIDGPRFG